MYAVEFEASIKDGIVHIPQQYKELQHTTNAKIIVIYNKDNKVQSQLKEFRRLRNQSNNKIMATMDLVTNIDKEMCDDGLF